MENTYTSLKVKRWVIEKAKEEAKKYHIELDWTGVDDDYVKIEGVILKETEKAICIDCGDGREYRVWIPKSQIAA